MRDQNVLQPECDPAWTGASIGENSGQKPHGVGAIGVADGFDVGVLVDVDAGADRDALRHVLRIARRARADQRFGIGAHMLAQLAAQGRQ